MSQAFIPAAPNIAEEAKVLRHMAAVAEMENPQPTVNIKPGAKIALLTLNGQIAQSCTVVDGAEQVPVDQIGITGYFVKMDDGERYFVHRDDVEQI